MKSNSKSTKAELEAYIAELEAKLNNLGGTEHTGEPVVQSAPATPQFTFVAPTSDVTIVYCSDSLGYAKVSNMELHFNCYGERFVLSRSQFDELVGKYRGWFDRGVLAVASENIDVAAAKGLPTEKEYNLTASILNSIGKMTPVQVEKLWNDNKTQSQKDSIVSFVKRKFIEGDQQYRNREKVDLLNRLTNGGFKREQDELDGRSKFTPTEM